MNVHEQSNFAALEGLFDHILHAKYLRGEAHGGIEPLSVQVVPPKG